MIFRSLPVEFDDYGRAHLHDEEATYPYSLDGDQRLQRALNRERALEKLTDNPGVWQFGISPFTRTAASPTLHTVIDFEQRRVLDARIEQPRFYGLERVLKEREPSEAVLLTSRLQGAISGTHATAAAMALEMACGVAPPPLAIIARNLGLCGEMISENTQHLFVLAGPDYCEAAVSRTSLSLWAKAQKTPAPGFEVHRMETIADIMRGINPMSGHLYLEALQMARLGREIATLMFGKYPHPSTIIPGGVGIEANKETFNQVLGRINTLLDYAKKVAAIWDDLVDFFYDAEPRYRRMGELPGNLLSVGFGEDHEVYDATYTNCKEWGEHRAMPPGVLINGELRTTRLSDINIGIESFVDHSYLEQWPLEVTAQRVPADPLSGPVSPWHPWNKQTQPQAVSRDWKERYSWAPAPRWDREPMETGPLARLWINVSSAKSNCEFIGVGRRHLEIALPRGQNPSLKLRWQLPERPNTLERNRARAYQIACSGMIGYANLLKAFDCIRRGETAMSVRFRAPEKNVGIGFAEAGPGTVMHHLVIRHRRINNYQVTSAAEWMGSPRDGLGVPGVYEAAVMNTPLLEECARPADFTGIDIQRTIRSFDP